MVTKKKEKITIIESPNPQTDKKTTNSIENTQFSFVKKKKKTIQITQREKKNTAPMS